MKPLRALVVLAVVFLVVGAFGCGGEDRAVAAPAVGRSAQALDGDGAWQPELPGLPDWVVWGDTVALDGCTYAVGTTMQLPPFPPVYPAFVYRSGHGAHCAAGFVTLGSSYGRPAVALAAGLGQLVADFTVRATPSGEAHSQLVLVELSPLTGTVHRQAWLAAMMPPAGPPNLGNVWSGALAVEPGGDVVVTGAKNGVIPGEVGAGTNYRAVFDRFVVGPVDGPATRTVTAW